jgi:hypothetical protein
MQGLRQARASGGFISSCSRSVAPLARCDGRVTRSQSSGPSQEQTTAFAPSTGAMASPTSSSSAGGAAAARRRSPAPLRAVAPPAAAAGSGAAVMKTVEVDLGDRSYPIYIGPGLLDQGELLRKHIPGKRVLIVTNTTIAPLYLDRCAAGHWLEPSCATGPLAAA